MIFIKVKNNFEWFHKWINAPQSESFLKYEHRHIFYVVSKIEVSENDRQLEYFAVKKYIQSVIERFVADSDKTESCEMMCEYILDDLETLYANSRIEIEVSEDDENGSIVNNFERFTNV